MSRALEPVRVILEPTTLTAACRVGQTLVHLRSMVNVMSLASGPARAPLERIDQTVALLLLLLDQTPAHLRSTVNVMSRALGPVRVTLERIDQTVVRLLLLPDQTLAHLRSTVNATSRALVPVRVMLERIDQIAADQRRRSRPLVLQPRAPQLHAPGCSQPSRVLIPRTRLTTSASTQVAWTVRSVRAPVPRSSVFKGLRATLSTVGTCRQTSLAFSRGPIAGPPGRLA
jgi:hypothetical protein